MAFIEINKALNKDFKLSVINEDERLIAGWASVEVVDKQGQYVDVETLAKAMLKFVDRGGFINYGHENKPVGKILQWEIRKHPDTDRPGVWIVAKINRGYKLDDIVWNMIKSGKLKGFSIAGLGGVEKRIMKADDGEEREVEVLKDIELTEISIVDEPANPYAVIEEVSVFAKGTVNEILKSDFVQGILDELWDKIDDILRKNGIEKSAILADDIVEEIEKAFGEYVTFIKSKFIEKVEGEVISGTEGMSNPVYGDKPQKQKEKDEDEDKDEKVEKSDKSEKIILRDLEGLERLEILKSNDRYKIRDLKTNSEYEVLEKALVEFKKPEDLRPPKEWWDRCIEETGRPGLCGWVYYHHLKPEKPPGQKDKPYTRKARQRKKKWMREKKSGEIRTKIEELKKELGIEGNIVEVRKPFAGFKNWDDCMKKMKEQGYDEESAKRICGKLKAEYEKSFAKKRLMLAKRIIKSLEIKKKLQNLKG